MLSATRVFRPMWARFPPHAVFRRTTAVIAINCLRAIHRFDRANSVTCAVFVARPRNRTFTSPNCRLITRNGAPPSRARWPCDVLPCGLVPSPGLSDGKVSSARSRGFYEGCSFWNYWTFRLGEEDSLTVTYGEDSGTSYEGPIEHATLHELKPQGIHVAEVALTQALQGRRG